MSTEDRMYRTIKSMLNDIEGVDGNIDKGGYKNLHKFLKTTKNMMPQSEKWQKIS